MIRSFGPAEFTFLLEAARWTLVLSLCAFVGGGLLGIVVALMRVSRNLVIRSIAAGWINVIQGTPVLIVLFLVFYGLPFFGLRFPPLIAAAAGMTIYASAFLAEIWRGCIEAVPRQQWEAASSLALKPAQRMIYVVLPQAFRLAVPPTVGFMVQIVKNTSVASIIGFVELTRAGTLMNNVTFQPFWVFGSVALLYFVMCWPLSVMSQRLERRLHAGRRS
ncbi:amino acid ABC transporter permease [Bosea sp. TWI1241]|jgi:polar amino acid transport system permease protein|uniref:amino acid ABC transporter permease n=1 Tax=Bosea sp. TWI1241 TaxID=3148904 RepID=UPI003208B279